MRSIHDHGLRDDRPEHGDEPGRLVRRFARTYGPVPIVVLLFVAATFIVAVLLDRETEQRERVVSQQLARDTTETIRGRLGTYTEALYGVRGLYQTVGIVSPETFSRNVNSTQLLERLPGIQVVGFAERVRDEDVAAFERRVALEIDRSGPDYPPFDVHPARRAGERVVINRVAPDGRTNYAAVGYDLLSERARTRAVTLARDTNQAVTTTPVRLVQGPETTGFIIMLPAYRPGTPTRTLSERRANFTGVIYAAFKAPTLMDAILGPTPRTFDIEIFDGGAEGAGNTVPTAATGLVYDVDGAVQSVVAAIAGPNGRSAAAPSNTQPTLADGFTLNRLDVPGRTWIVAYRPLASVLSTAERWLPIGIVLGGLLLTSLVAGLMVTLARSRARALRLAAVMGERVEVARMKEDFTAVVSHELRTPLTAIHGSLELLARHASDGLSPRGRRLVDIAQTNAGRLRRLVDDILDFERLQVGRTPNECNWCDVEVLVDEATDLVRSSATARDVTVTSSSAPCRLWTDGQRVTQILTNLLDNAIKFSPPGGRIVVEAAVAPKQVAVTVTDHGRGIPAAMCEQVFLPFAQLDASDSRERGGTGLGLSICRSIVEGLGGEIRASPNPIGGTIVTFVLPRIEPDRTGWAPSPENAMETSSA